MSKEAMDQIAQGRVWTGTRAKELGLVDELGGLDKAIEIAIEKAGIDAYTLMSYPAKKSAWEQLKDFNAGSYVKAQLLQGEMGRLYRQIETTDQFQPEDAIQAHMFFEPNIH